MVTRGWKIWLMLLVVTSIVLTGCGASKEFTISGTVYNTNGQPWDNVELVVDGKVIKTNANGQWSTTATQKVRITPAPIADIEWEPPFHEADKAGTYNFAAKTFAGFNFVEDFESYPVNHTFPTELTGDWTWFMTYDERINRPYISDAKAVSGSKSLRVHWDDYLTATATESARAILKIVPPASGQFEVSYKLFIDSAEKRNLAFRMFSSGHGAHTYASQGKYWAQEKEAAAEIGAFNIGQWNTVKLTVDVNTYTYTVEINGVPAARPYEFRSDVPIDYIAIHFQVNRANLNDPHPDVYIDDLVVKEIL